MKGFLGILKAYWASFFWGEVHDTPKPQTLTLNPKSQTLNSGARALLAVVREHVGQVSPFISRPGFKVQGSGFRGLRFRVWGFSGLGVRVAAVALDVQGGSIGFISPFKGLMGFYKVCICIQRLLYRVYISLESVYGGLCRVEGDRRGLACFFDKGS